MKKKFYSSTRKRFPLSKHFYQYLKDKLEVVEVQRSYLEQGRRRDEQDNLSGVRMRIGQGSPKSRE